MCIGSVYQNEVPKYSLGFKQNVTTTCIIVWFHIHRMDAKTFSFHVLANSSVDIQNKYNLSRSRCYLMQICKGDIHISQRCNEMLLDQIVIKNIILEATVNRGLSNHWCTAKIFLATLIDYIDGKLKMRQHIPNMVVEVHPSHMVSMVTFTSNVSYAIHVIASLKIAERQHCNNQTYELFIST